MANRVLHSLFYALFRLDIAIFEIPVNDRFLTRMSEMAGDGVVK